VLRCRFFETRCPARCLPVRAAPYSWGMALRAQKRPCVFNTCERHISCMLEGRNGNPRSWTRRARCGFGRRDALRCRFC
jgi:hypothetical protein